MRSTWGIKTHVIFLIKILYKCVLNLLKGEKLQLLTLRWLNFQIRPNRKQRPERLWCDGDRKTTEVVCQAPFEQKYNYLLFSSIDRWGYRKPFLLPFVGNSIIYNSSVTSLLILLASKNSESSSINGTPSSFKAPKSWNQNWQPLSFAISTKSVKEVFLPSGLLNIYNIIFLGIFRTERKLLWQAYFFYYWPSSKNQRYFRFIRSIIMVSIQCF